MKDNPERIFWCKIYLVTGVAIFSLFLFIKKIEILSLYYSEILWSLGWAAFGVGFGLWNSRTAHGEVLEKKEHYYTYFIFVEFVAGLAAFVAFGTFQDDSIRSYAAAALTGLIVGFIGDSLPERFIGLTK